MLAVAWGHDIEASFRQAFFMLWATLWPLILGFGLSGCVQAFVSKERMQRTLGNHRPSSVARAAGFGAASSSCSYAAAAMARSLYVKGADFVSALVFMFASTNLVLELGIVLVVLLGWQFALAEATGGVIMIVALALTGGIVVGRSLQARTGTPQADPSSPATSEEPAPRLVAAFGYAWADLRMLWRELLIGYLVAGTLAALIPTHVWNDFFLRGHGAGTSIENVLVGPLVAIASFVCSVGNVPLAAALWKGGISFGGAVSFIFADLITFPLLLVYRRYYGTRMTLRLLAWFWLLMSGAGLAVDAIANAAGLVPAHHLAQAVNTGFQWNYTAYLNLVFLVGAGAVYWRYRRKRSDDPPACSVATGVAPAA